MTIIAKIREYGIPVTSHFDAQRSLKSVVFEKAGTEQKDFEGFVSQLTGIAFSSASQKQAELVANYIVIESVKRHTEGYVDSGEAALEAAIEKANDFLVKNGWIVAASVTAPVGGDGIHTPSTPQVMGKIKRAGASKKDLAIALFNKDDNNTKTRKELLELFMTELGLTLPGASTYVHNCQKGLWK